MWECGDVEMWECGDVGMWRCEECGNGSWEIGECAIAKTKGVELGMKEPLIGSPGGNNSGISLNPKRINSELF
jgi:hypothetical protein